MSLLSAKVCVYQRYIFPEKRGKKRKRKNEKEKIKRKRRNWGNKKKVIKGKGNKII